MVKNTVHIIQMNVQAEETAAPILDVVKQVITVLMLVSGVVAFYYYSEFPLLYRVLALLAVFVVAALLMLTTMSGRGFWGFVQESRQEVRKVVWPSKQETTTTTLLVFAAVLVVGLLLYFFDWILSFGVQYLLGFGG